MIWRILFILMLLLLVGCQPQIINDKRTDSGNSAPIHEDVIPAAPATVLLSGIFRSLGTQQLSYSQESESALIGLSSAYHEIPDVDFDDDEGA